MQVVKLVKPYRTANSQHNAGEFIGVTDKEAEFILDKKLGIQAKTVRITKAITRAEAPAVLGKSFEARKGAKTGQAYTLDAVQADKLIKSGAAVELIQAAVLQPFRDAQGHQRNRGVFGATAEELKKYQADGNADVFVHPTDDIDQEIEAQKEAQAEIEANPKRKG